MRTMKMSELVFDFDVYPRADVDRQHVGHIAQAIAAGTEMPPIVIEKRSKRIVDGFHRGKAFIRLYGENHEVQVVEKNYKTEADLLLDAISYNSSHGRTLTTYDRAHCAILAANMGVDDEALAGALHVTSDYIGNLRVDRSATSGGLHVPIKRTISHMAGKKLTKEQQKANESLSGMQQMFYVNQVITLIENDLLDTADENLMQRLSLLAGLISGLAVGSK